MHKPIITWGSAALFFVVAVVLVVMFIRVNNLSEETHYIADNNRRTLCVFRADLNRRVKTAQEFLTEHPEGISGISAGSIRVSILNQQKTLRSFQYLNCKE